MTQTDNSQSLSLVRLKSQTPFLWINDRMRPAAAGFPGPLSLFSTEEGREYLAGRGISNCMDGAVHILWTTGGLFVPAEEFEAFRLRGERAYAQEEGKR